MKRLTLVIAIAALVVAFAPGAQADGVEPVADYLGDVVAKAAGGALDVVTSPVPLLANTYDGIVNGADVPGVLGGALSGLASGGRESVAQLTTGALDVILCIVRE